MDICFCQTQKEIKINPLKRCCYSLNQPIYEPPTKLPCCGKSVHSSCMKTYLLSKRNELIDGKSHSETSAIILKDIDKCVFCQQFLNFENFNIYSNQEKKLLDQKRTYSKIYKWLWIIGFSLIGIMLLVDPIVLSTVGHTNMLNLCHKTIDPADCRVSINEHSKIASLVSRAHFLIYLSVFSLMIMFMIWCEINNRRMNGTLWSWLTKIMNSLDDYASNKISWNDTQPEWTIDIYKIKRYQNEKEVKKIKTRWTGGVIMVCGQLVHLTLVILFQTLYLKQINVSSVHEIELSMLYYLPIFIILNPTSWIILFSSVTMIVVTILFLLSLCVYSGMACISFGEMLSRCCKFLRHMDINELRSNQRERVTRRITRNQNLSLQMIELGEVDDPKLKDGQLYSIV